MKKPLEHLIDQLEHKLPGVQPKAAVAVDQEKLKTVCAKLEALLVDDDSEAIDVLDSHAELLGAAFPDHYRKIDDGIRSFDFEVALMALREARGKQFLD